MPRGTKGGITARPHKGRGTGRYVICPGSGSLHPPYAREVLLSNKGNLWFSCPSCGFRGHFDRGGEPGMTKEAIGALGAVIPDAIGM